MTTENDTPGPGSPEWLRYEARRLEAPATSGSVFLAVTMAAGLRAAAERLDELESNLGPLTIKLHDAAERIEQLTAKTCEYAAEISRLRAENEALRKDKEGLCSLVREYLSHSSIDGAPVRQELRKRLAKAARKEGA